MKDDDVVRLTKRVTTLGSWTGAATEELMLALSNLTDLRCAEAAVDELVGTWDANFRPPVARVLTMYRVKYDAFRLRQPEMRESLVVVPPSQGYDIAMTAYVADCRERGIPVDVDKFHRIMGAFVRERVELEPDFKPLVPRDPSGPNRDEDF